MKKQSGSWGRQPIKKRLKTPVAAPQINWGQLGVVCAVVFGWYWLFRPLFRHSSIPLILVCHYLNIQAMYLAWNGKSLEWARSLTALNCLAVLIGVNSGFESCFYNFHFTMPDVWSEILMQNVHQLLLPVPALVMLGWASRGTVDRWHGMLLAPVVVSLVNVLLNAAFITLWSTRIFRG